MTMRRVNKNTVTVTVLYSIMYTTYYDLDHMNAAGKLEVNAFALIARMASRLGASSEGQL